MGILDSVLKRGGKTLAAYIPKEQPAKDSTMKSKKLRQYNALRDLYIKHGAIWSEVNLFGIRDSADQQKDIFNDTIGIAYGDGKVNLYRGTCDPGRYWTERSGAAVDKKGVAHLCLGFHQSAYVIGKHFDQTAFVQQGNKVKIWRDANKNYLQDTGEKIEQGYYGINIHTTKKPVPMTVGQWSAGCQVLQEPDDLAEMITIARTSSMFINGGAKTRFSYFLFSKEQIGKLLG